MANRFSQNAFSSARRPATNRSIFGKIGAGRRDATIALGATLLLASCQAIPSWLARPEPPTAGILDTPWDDRSVFEVGLAPSARSILGELPGASVYHLELEIDDDRSSVRGHEEIFYTNTEMTALSELNLRLFPNILGGEMHVSDVRVNDTDANPALSLEGSLLTVTLPNPLEPGASTVLSMDFAVSVPQTLELNYGVLAFAEDVLALAHAYPMLAVYDDEGWNAEIPSQSGDLTYADMGFFLVQVTAPRELVIAATGRELERAEQAGKQVVTYAAGPARDFYLAASEEYEVHTRQAGAVTIRFYAPPDRASTASDSLEIAADSIRIYEDHYAPFPYSELDIVSTPTLALGIEYPGIIAITEQIIGPNEPYFEGVLAHEIGHQWFYNLVGNDQLDDPWLDEALAQFATLQYFSDQYGENGADGFRASLNERAQRVDDPDMPIGLPVAAYSGREYGAIVYGRGPLFFEALRDEMGEDAFDAFMRAYVTEYSWGVATPEGLQAAAESACSCDLTQLFEAWVYP